MSFGILNVSVIKALSVSLVASVDPFKLENPAGFEDTALKIAGITKPTNRSPQNLQHLQLGRSIADSWLDN